MHDPHCIGYDREDVDRLVLEIQRSHSMLSRLMDAVDDDSESRLSDEMRAAGRYLRESRIIEPASS